MTLGLVKMLRPTKYSHPDKTVINIAFIILKQLKIKRIENFSTLYHYVKNTVQGGETLFLPALDLLFILGLIEYRPKTDSFEYLGGV